MEKFKTIEEFSEYMSESYMAIDFSSLKNAVKMFPNLFYSKRISEISGYLINENDTYICYVFDKGEKVFIIASYYEDNTIREIFIPDEFQCDFDKSEIDKIYSFVPFFSQYMSDNGTSEFNNIIKKYNGVYNEENIKDLFINSFNAKEVSEQEVYDNCYLIRNIEMNNINQKEKVKNQFYNFTKKCFYLEGEKFYIPRLEKECYIAIEFSNNKLISVMFGFSHFKYRRQLEQLVDVEEVMKLLS